MFSDLGFEDGGVDISVHGGFLVGDWEGWWLSFYREDVIVSCLKVLEGGGDLRVAKVMSLNYSLSQRSSVLAIHFLGTTVSETAGLGRFKWSNDCGTGRLLLLPSVGNVTLQTVEEFLETPLCVGASVQNWPKQGDVFRCGISVLKQS